jgi:hypothetical protein
LLSEIEVSRIINPDSAGKERTRLTRAIVLAIRELAQQSESNIESRDLAAFIALALAIIAESIDISVAAWEKRDYWVKADRFRMDWAWASLLAEKMRLAVLTDDWGTITEAAAVIAQKLNKINLPARNRIGKPWVGAWNELQNR